MFRFPCPSCGKRLKAPEDKVGVKVTCTRCGRALQVPPPTGIVREASWQEAPPVRKQAAPPAVSLEPVRPGGNGEVDAAKSMPLLVTGDRPPAAPPPPPPCAAAPVARPAPMAKIVPTAKIVPPPAEPPPAASPAPGPEAPPKPSKKKRKPPERGEHVLIPCDVCGRQIATQAAACPGCGAPNEWLHPEIRAFLREQREYGFGIRNLKTEARGCVLTGYARRPRGLLDAAGQAVGSLGFIGPATLGGIVGVLGASMAARAVADELRRAAGPDGEAFLIDFRTEPPGWQSTNDDFWDEVMCFFDL
jgi:hypothetical protein